MKEIRIRGAREHNLKDLSLNIPHDRFVVITGVSGSGKSSLAFDTVFQQAQMRFLEVLSPYARRFLEKVSRPDVESIEGLRAGIAVDQKSIAANPRSTVGTVTEIYDYLRLLFSRVSEPFCPVCGRKLGAFEPDEIASAIEAGFSGKRIKILAPLIKGKKGEHREVFNKISRMGFVRARVDGKIMEISPPPALERFKTHNIEVLVDELVPSGKRLERSVKRALEISGESLIVISDGEEILYSTSLHCPYCGISLPSPEPRLFSFNSPYGACPACGGTGFRLIIKGEEQIITEERCEECGGIRLRSETLSFKIDGKDIGYYVELPATVFKKRLIEIEDLWKNKIASRIAIQIKERLEIMEELGIGYLTMNRPIFSLSGGEAQRVRLASQLGAKIRGALYVLDEPSIGLHPRDQKRLIEVLKRIRDFGNTVIVVEHDEMTIRSADHIIDMGPGGGESGGRIVASGPISEILSSSRSITGAYLRKEKFIDIPYRRRKPKDFLFIKGARIHNLKNLNVKIPLGVFLVVTGVSGSGKSSLIIDTLFAALKGKNESFDKIEGAEKVKEAVLVDQKPIGRTPRSNPATYTGVFTHIRKLFSSLPEAKKRGFNHSRFSFNLKEGRCPVCKGAGVIRIRMHFLPDVFTVCNECQGKRYRKEVLEVRFRGKNINDVLEMTVEEAYKLFRDVPQIERRLKLLKDIGLGYIKLGQPSPNLSGGEAQRVKITKELTRNVKSNLYILDEPTVGLHFDDVKKLLRVLHRLVDEGATVIVIEHNLDVIKNADWIIDLGPEGGEEGGRIVAQGTPEEVCRANTYTGRFLREVLNGC